MKLTIELKAKEVEWLLQEASYFGIGYNEMAAIVIRERMQRRQNAFSRSTPADEQILQSKDWKGLEQKALKVINEIMVGSRELNPDDPKILIARMVLKIMKRNRAFE